MDSGKILELENLYHDIWCNRHWHNLLFTCNGRSLGYRKYLDDVGGYHISNIIGGDDDLLAHKIIDKSHCKVSYIIEEDSCLFKAPKTFDASLIKD